MENNRSNQAVQRLSERLALLILAIVFVALAVWSWRKWTDVLVDFGLQLYTPWLIAEGKVLYRDVSYIAGGPLSQYYHALLFKVFEPGYVVIVWSNLIIAGLLTWGIFRMFARAADLLTAFAIGLVTMCVFVFGHLTSVGNYNFISPYTCETVHGFGLAVLGIVALERWLLANRKRWIVAAGAALGGVFLTKPEIFLAASGSLVLAVIIREATKPDNWRGRARNLFLLVASGLIPATLFAMYSFRVWPTRDGLLAAAGAWLPLLGGKAGHGQYYAWCMGLDTPGANLFEMLQYTAALVLIVVVLALGCRFIARKKPVVAVGIWGALAIFLFSPANRLEWVQGGRALPPLALGSATLLIWKWWRTRRTPAGERLFFPLLWSVFALLLLAKMGLNARLWQYGYYLALPATALVLLCLLRELPSLIKAFEIDPEMFRRSLLVFFGIGVIKLLAVSQHYYGMKIFPLASGVDRMMTYPPDLNLESAPAGKGIGVTVDWLRTNTPQQATLAVLPEGSMVNYLARRPNSTPYVVANPHELQVAGEARVTAAFAARLPDYVLLMHRHTSEFGVGFFGAPDGFGESLAQLVNTNYSEEWLFGGEPLVTNRFGMKMYRRNGP